MMNTHKQQPNRRQFLKNSSLACAGMSLATRSSAGANGLFRNENQPFEISLAQWTLVRELRSGKIDNLDFAKVAHEHGIQAIEYVNQFFMDKAQDSAYLSQMNNGPKMRE